MKPLLVTNNGGTSSLSFLSLFFSPMLFVLALLHPCIPPSCNLSSSSSLFYLSHNPSSNLLPSSAGVFFISLVLTLSYHSSHYLYCILLPFLTFLIFLFFLFIFRDTDCLVTAGKGRIKSRKHTDFSFFFYLFDFILCNSALPFFSPFNSSKDLFRAQVIILCGNVKRIFVKLQHSSVFDRSGSWSPDRLLRRGKKKILKIVLLEKSQL